MDQLGSQERARTRTRKAAGHSVSYDFRKLTCLEASLLGRAYFSNWLIRSPGSHRSAAHLAGRVEERFLGLCGFA